MSKFFSGSGKLLQELHAIDMDQESLRDLIVRVKMQPHFLGEPLVVIGEAADFPQVSHPEHYDLLALDRQGRCTVISLCIGVADADRDLHALQFTAHIASLTVGDLGKIARTFINRSANDALRRAWEEKGVEMDEESVELSSLLASMFARDAEDYAEIINQEQRVVVAAENFTSRLVNLVQWLVNAGVMIQGLQYQKYLVGGQEVFFAEQVVPRKDPAIDASEGITMPTELTHPWRVKGQLYHTERLLPSVAHQLNKLILLTRETTFSVNWVHKYYFWIRGEHRNLRVRTYARDRLEVGFQNTTAEALSALVKAYDLEWLDITTIGGYADSPFITITGETELNEKWKALLCDWLSGKNQEL